MRETAIDPADRLDRRQAEQVLRRAARWLGPYRRDLTVAGLCVVVWTLGVLAGPLLVRYGIDRGIAGDDPGALRRAMAAYVSVAAVSYLVYRQQVLALSRAGEAFLRDLRRRVFAHLQQLPMSFYDRSKAGVVVSRLTSDIDSLSELLQVGLLQLLMNSLLLVLSLVVLFVVSWELTLVALLALPPVLVASRRFQRDSNAAYLEVRDGIGSTLSHLQESLTGVRVIQAAGREDYEVRRFAGRNQALYDAHMRSVRVQSWYLPVIEMAGYGTTALVVGIGGWRVVDGSESLGTVAFFVLTLNNLFEPIQQLSQLFNTVQSATAGLRKVFGLLDEPVELDERPGAVDLPLSGPLEVASVTFAYADGTPVLDDVSLVVQPGERLALVGPTGAGKSTLAKVMARFYDPTAGSVRFGDVDLRDATAATLRQRIVVVPQEGFLFNGTLADNVRLARADATDDEVAAALDALGVLERFDALPEGLSTAVDERGSRLSAGERQLVSLARAALVDPAVLVLDEATSNLDPGTEALVEAAVERLSAGRTTVVIAHRLSSAVRADRVGVVVDGRLAQLGPHAELVALDGPYRALFRTWQAGHDVGSAAGGDGPAAPP